MKKRRFLTIGGLVILIAFVATAADFEFWASKKSDKYHYPECRWAKKIKPYNLIKFSSPEEAVAAGYVPCKVCKPPLPSKSESRIDEERCNYAILVYNFDLGGH
jgi:methylphosphotriester-DNA--protein-cysteine methyltransferase